MTKLKLLLTGATGFIGMNFILQLHDKYAITALVRKTSNTEKIKSHCEIYCYDENPQSLLQLFQKEHFDGIVHLATLYLANHTPQDIKNLIDSNIRFSCEILESCTINPPIFFINALSYFEYANSKNYNPANFYSATKHAFYNICKYYANSLPTTFSHLMLYDTYGSNDTRAKIFNIWQKIAKNGEVLEMSKGEQRLDISHIHDVINGYDTLITLCLNKQAINNQIYTLENKRHSLKELAVIFEKYTNSKLNIKWGAKPYRENEIMEPITSKDSSLLQRLPTWNPKITLQEGFKMLINAKIMGGGGQNPIIP